MRKLTEQETFKLIESARSGYVMDSMIEVDLNAKLSRGASTVAMFRHGSGSISRMPGSKSSPRSNHDNA